MGESHKRPNWGYCHNIERTDSRFAVFPRCAGNHPRIDKLSKHSSFRVPAATASFYFKYKKIPVAEIARTLGVVYILDGSTRQSGNSVRIAARLVRAENGYVIWSETYDRPFVNRVAVQDEIAGEVTRALKASIEGTLNPVPSQ